ncbi:J-type chaperone [Saccharomycopsis crataegensis]|uniref:J-type chaperone n=1 Tax=Saccharomycopsis crataegensis TaxID=43959 RepID=A0AAV5QQP2_9ASCO|nr:J-type chaperone [Saccharomycopsis crataegensis]
MKHSLYCRPFTLFRRLYATKPHHQPNYFQLFPRTFPNHGPPNDRFLINPKLLRKEYLQLQGETHPDLLLGLSGSNASNAEGAITAEEIVAENSKVLNRAYAMLKSPLTRSQHYLMLNDIDIMNDDDNNNSSSTSSSSQFRKIASQDQELLLMILDIHEQLETCGSQEELKQLKVENDQRIVEAEKILDDLYYNHHDLQNAAVETIKLNYWCNIKNAIKEWEPGKAVNLTH